MSPLYMKRVAVLGAQLLVEYLIFASNSEAYKGIHKIHGHSKL